MLLEKSTRSPSGVNASVGWNRRNAKYRSTGDAVLIAPVYGAGLLDRHRLREVARLVDVEAAQPGDPIREELEREHREDGLQERRRLGHVDHLIGVVLDVLVAVGRHGDHV